MKQLNDWIQRCKKAEKGGNLETSLIKAYQQAESLLFQNTEMKRVLARALVYLPDEDQSEELKNDIRKYMHD